MSEQNYSNHRRIDPGFHVVLFLLMLVTLIGSVINLYHSWGVEGRFYSAALLVATLVALFLATFYARLYALKAQDRAIRAEENLRHFVLTGELLDSRLTTRQIIGLRFAADDEFLTLAKSAAESGTPEKEIKQSIQTWRPDNYRV